MSLLLWEVVPVALALGACHVPQKDSPGVSVWTGKGWNPGVAERPGGLSSGGDSWKFLPSIDFRWQLRFWAAWEVLGRAAAKDSL